jgi:hypothetical protein
VAIVLVVAIIVGVIIFVVVRKNKTPSYKQWEMY